MSRYLFVCGCARSGTSVMASFLNSHGRVAIGLERYLNLFKTKPELFRPSLFDPARFLQVLPGDTFYGSLDAFMHYRGIEAKLEGASYLGDKIPVLYRRWPVVRDHFPDAKVVFVTRDLPAVAASYKARALASDGNWPASRDAYQAIDDWNEAQAAAVKGLQDLDLFVLDYETWLASDGGSRLLSFLGLEMDDSMATAWRHIKGKSDKLRASRQPAGALDKSELAAIARRGHSSARHELIAHAHSLGRAL